MLLRGHDVRKIILLTYGGALHVHLHAIILALAYQRALTLNKFRNGFEFKLSMKLCLDTIMCPEKEMYQN